MSSDLTWFQRAWRDHLAYTADELLQSTIPRVAACVLERRWNDGSPSGFRVALEPRFAPEGQSPSFALQMLNIDRTDITHFGEAYGRALGVPVKGVAVFPTHPGFRVASFVEPSRGPEVVPLASGRTVAVVGTDDIEDHGLKLHYPAKLGRFHRDLSIFKVVASLQRSTKVSEALKSIEGVAVQDEVGGSVASPEWADRPFGVIVRRTWPEKSRNALLLPFFSLWAKPPVGERTILQALADFMDTRPDELILRIVDVLIPAYFELSVTHGLLPEVNAQNLLIDLDRGSTSIRLLIRDMQDVFIDLVACPGQLSSSTVDYKLITPESGDVLKRRSYAYDFKLSHYVIDPLVQAVSSSPSETVRVVREIRAAARREIARYPDYFANEQAWYSYAPVANVSRHSYVRNETNPRYR